AVNLAPAQADDPDLVATVNAVLDAAGLPPDRLRLGLPVSALLAERGDADDNARVLAARGVHLTVHGFGGGYGGLVLLEDLPVRSVWIADRLVAHVAGRPDSVTARALRSMVPLVHALDAEVVAGGVRSAAAADWWRDAGADLAWSTDAGPPEAIIAPPHDDG
ncbi:MAG TPA: EAL domain-containing protein, partial [Pseudonocardiaceae bacterium]